MGRTQRTGWLVAGTLMTLGGVGLLFSAFWSLPRPSPAEVLLPTSVLLQQPEPAATAVVTLVVHVAGAVLAPGVYELPAHTRIADAVAAAGGLRPDADAASINLAAYLQDAQQIYVPVIGTTDRAAADAARPPVAAAPFTVDLNTASVAELDQLPGVGPVLAQRIIDYREQHGPFQQVEDLKQVPGIGEALLAEIAPHAQITP